VVVTAVACVMLASVVTPVSAAAAHRAKVPAKKPAPTAGQGGGPSGPVSLEWAVRALLRP
jgi:hypothetical protein